MRLTRITRILKMFKRSLFDRIGEKIEEKLGLSPAFRRIIEFLIGMMICVHIMGCFWYYAAKLEDFGEDTWVTKMAYDR